MLILRELGENDESAFFDGLKEWPEEDLSWHSFIWRPGMSYAEMLERLRKDHLGIDLPGERVPHTMLYGFVDGRIVGRLSVRHELNERLKKRGGHIGYAVAPQFRRQGYATQMVDQGLNYCRGLGLTEIMITCSDSNIPSFRILENLGARLSDKVWDDEDQEMIRRYWLKLNP